MNDREAAAEKAELTGQIRSFMAWLGEGRKLTQTGRIGLADARHLVELLTTGDRIDPEIGNQIVKTKFQRATPVSHAGSGVDEGRAAHPGNRYPDGASEEERRIGRQAT